MNNSKTNVWGFVAVFTALIMVSVVFAGIALAHDTKSSSTEEVAEIPEGTFQLQIGDYGKYLDTMDAILASTTSDGFDYPVGATGYVTEDPDGDGWYNAQDFGEPNPDFGNKLHLGEDWNGEGGGDTDCGEPVYAVSKGTIVYAGDAGSGWGNVVIIRHELPDGSQVESLYGHLQSISKTSGDVDRREQIGTIGKNGWPSCHLHFEIRFSNCLSWGSPGPGYSFDTTGWTDPSDFIDANRQLGGDTSLCSDIDLIFILDRSGSMDTVDAVLPDGTTVSRLEAAKFATKNFIDLLPTGTGTRVGVVSYESYGDAKIEQSLTSDFTAAKTAVDSITTGDMTSIGEGIKKGIDELQAHGITNKRIFLLLTDGKANEHPPGWSPPAGWTPPAGSWTTAEQYALYEAHVALTFDLTNPTKTYTVGVGYQTSINENLLQVLASASGGKYFFAGTTSIQEMFDEIAADICAGDVEVLILANFQRMKDIGYDSASVDNLKTKLQDLADNNPNGRGFLVDLDTIASIKTAYTNWNGNEGDVTRTNNLVQAIDNHIEDQKQNKYPKLKYVILVGSHEVLPMKARPDDYNFKPWWCFWCEKINEKRWADRSLPQKSGYLYDIYHAGAEGYYLTDTIYGDLYYRDSSADHELTPELAVGRLVETPDQITTVIDAYMNNNGEIPKNHYVSMASYDYLDGGTQAKDDMVGSGVSTDSTLVQCAYVSSNVPPMLNTRHDTVYFAGHGDYNWITTIDTRDGVSHSNDGFMAGNSAAHGDTSEVNSIDGAVIITAGCHNGVNFGNKKYHEPDAGTTYSEFPEEFAKKGVTAYVGATGYTVISGTKCDSNKGLTGYNEKLATNIVNRLVGGRDIGTAFKHGMLLYYIEHIRDFKDVDRRVLAIPTLYGIPTYKYTITSDGVISSDSGIGYNIQKVSLGNSQLYSERYNIQKTNLGNPQPDSEQVTITITNYSVNFTSGLVIIPGATQAISFNEPIVPVLFVEKTLPYGANISAAWNESASANTIVTNDVPIAGVACSEVIIEGSFSYDGFYPVTPYANYSILTLGGGGAKVGIAVNPVQYNSQTNQTKIWTKMVFDIQYNIPDTGISVVGLSTDKYQYSPKENVTLDVSISNSGITMAVDLSMVMRDANTNEEITTTTIGSMGLAGGTTSSGTYSIDLKDIPQVRGKTIEGELIVLDPNNDNVLGSDSVSFSVRQSILETDLLNVELISADPTVTSINVTSLNLSEVNETYKPEECLPQLAYVINSTGTGNFTLKFTDIPNANTIIVYKINATNQWIELDTTTTTDNVTFTMSVGDPPVVFASGAFIISVDLYTGWNLLSLPLQPANLSASSVLPTIPTAGGIAYLWNASKGQYDAIYGNIELELGRAYWIAIASDGTWTPTGTDAHGIEVNLTPDWNMIGVPSPANVSAQDITITVGANTYNLVDAANNGYIGGIFYPWNATTEKYDATVISDTAELKPGIGYFAIVNQECSITYP